MRSIRIGSVGEIDVLRPEQTKEATRYRISIMLCICLAECQQQASDPPSETHRPRSAQTIDLCSSQATDAGLVEELASFSGLHTEGDSLRDSVIVSTSGSTTPRSPMRDWRIARG